VTGRSVALETLGVQQDGAVLFAEIAAPPMNLLGPALVRDLVSLIQRAEADEEVRVLVFTSADPDYFISHVDVTSIAEYRQEAAKLTGEASIALLFHHLSASRLVTIAQIEGRVRAAGSEFVSALAHRIAGFPAAAHAVVKDRVNAIALAPVDDFRRDSDLFGSGVTEPEAQARIRAAIERGLQTRDAERDLTRVFG